MRDSDRKQLDEKDIVEVLEYLAGRATALAVGERKLTIVFSNGKVRRVFVELGPLRPDEASTALA